MGVTLNESTEWGKPSSVTNGPASTERVLRREPDGLVAEFRVSVDGDHPVSVTVRDEFPPDLNVERASFSDDTGLTDAEATPTGATFESVVAPGEVLEAAYELQLGSEPETTWGPPEIVRTLPMDEHTDGGGVVREPMPSDAGRDGIDDGRPTGGATGTAPAPTATVEALVEAFRSDELSEEQLGVLRDRLTDRTSSSADVRIRRVEAELARFEAYIDALEAFIEENGTAQEAFAELRADLERQQTELGTLRQTQQAAEAERADVAADVDTVRADVAAVSDEIEALRAETDELREEVEELRSLMESLSSVFAGDSDPSDLPGQ